MLTDIWEMPKCVQSFKLDEIRFAKVIDFHFKWESRIYQSNPSNLNVVTGKQAFTKRWQHFLHPLKFSFEYILEQINISLATTNFCLRIEQNLLTTINQLREMGFGSVSEIKINMRVIGIELIR